ncbi:filamentous hemagglutinin N-terminal domain-containing protein [Paraburkholderia sp. CNPSo 3272]|uniref:filamentous hemagglutinin N-terminal domain-containing protein n=1 Tax=Paraburkholderia sp. CNPSo 3272 TaxID=2940931 RepID=UPI0020B8C0C1|nr:filamentous hemagglutinin N-terminal domain-containing protein [Paraburkholderia sp. CNPSo 3272]MCP3728377.1 filamentous hemagglutinin N-terminal domain-containing protein [Paraburkholderia sp. CNPSo 3272]
MYASQRGTLKRLASARMQRNAQRARHDAPAWLIVHAPPRFRFWRRAVALLVAVVSFLGPISFAFEQGRDAAGVLGAGSHRLDDEAWQVINDLAALRVRFAMQAAEATPIVDPTAPITFQPKITQSTGAGGGVPVVNITAPNSAGISLNQFQTFNIDPVGLILNNSLASGTSLTGGDVAANPNLNGRTASVIVNQVTSTGSAFASLLNGPLEVFGAPATVIIANPNGITTRGTGFTNTVGVTLATGTPQFLSGIGGSQVGFDNAQAIGYNVTGGHIQIEGNPGVNGPGAGIEGTVGTIDLIGATIGVNAPLYAGTRINAIAGVQNVAPTAVDSTGTTWSTSANGATNTAAAINAASGGANGGLAIDATAYGAMTAGQIQMIGTAAGMGVRTDAQLAANTGDITLSANGDVSMAGTAAQQKVSVQSGGSVTLAGSHIGITGYSIAANGDVTSSGTIQTNGALTATAGGNLNVANAQAQGDIVLNAGANATTGDIQAGSNLAVTAQGHDGAGDVTLGGATVATGATTLNAARDVTINGATSSGSLQATAQRNVNVNAATQTSGVLALNATTGNLITTASVNSNGNLALSSGTGTTIGAQATALDAVNLTAGSGGIAVTGSLASGTTLNATTPGAFSVSGSLLVGTNANVSAGSMSLDGVTIVQQNGAFNAAAGITGAGSVAFGQSGALTAGGDVTLTGKLLANGLQVGAGGNVALNDVQAGGAFAVTAGTGNATFNGNAAAVGTTTVQAGTDIDVNGTLAGGSGVTLSAQHDVNVAAAATVQSVGDLAMSAANNIAASGTLNSGGALTAQAGQDVAMTGATSATGDTVLAAGRDVTLGGTFAGQGGATITAGRDAVLGGSIGISKDVSVSAANNLTTTGSLQGDHVTLNAGNSAALADIQANSALAINAQGNAGGGDVQVNGTVASLGNAAVTAAASVSVPGTLEASGTLGVTAATDTHVSGTVQSNGDLTLANTAGSLLSTGVIQSGANLSANAGQSIELGSDPGTSSTASLGDMTLMAAQNVMMNGSVVAQGNGTVTAGNAIGGAGTLAFGLAANLASGGDTTLTGSLRGATVQTTAGGSGSFANVSAGSTIALFAQHDVNLGGTLAGGAGVALNAGNDVNVTGTLQSAGDTTLAAQTGSVNVSGALNSSGALGITAGTDANVSGSATAALDTTIQAARDVNVGGSVNGQGNGSVSAGRDIGGAGTLAFGQSAILSATRNIVQGGLVQGQSIQVTAGADAALNNVESASTLSLGVGTLGSGSLTVNGAAASAGAFSATANGDVTVAQGGKLASGTTLGVAALGGIAVAGAIEANSDVTLNAQNGSLAATGGINSGGNLAITTGLDLSLGASTSATGDATLNAGRDAVLNGTLVATNGTVSAGRDISGAGTQAFTGAAVLGAQGNIALSGTLQANSVQATGGDNAALNNVSSATTLAITANGTSGNATTGDAAITGTATSQGAITLTGARDVLVSGSAGSGATLTLNAQRNAQVTGALESVGDLDVSAQTGSATLGGTATTSGAFNVTAGLDATLGGQNAAAGNVTVQAGRDVALTGTVAGQMAGTFNAGRDMTGAGSAAFANAATLTAANNLALTGSLQGASVSATGGNNAGLGSVQAVSGNLSVLANGSAGEGDVTFTGPVTALGNVTLQAARDIGIGGALNAGGTTNASAARNISAADVNSAGDLTLTATNGSASAGNVTTQGNLNASAGQSLAFTGQTQAGGNAALTSGGDMTLAGGVAAQGTGTLQAGGTIGGASVAFGQQATLNAGNNIAIGGAVTTNGDLAATAGNGVAMGSATAGGSVTVKANGNSGTGDIVVTNGVTSGTATTLTAARDVQTGGALSSGATLAVTAGRNASIRGTAAANGDVDLKATSGNLSVAGGITTGGHLNANAGASATLLAGALVNGDTTVSAGNGMTLSGAFLGLGAGTFTAGSAIGGGGALTFVNDIGVSAGGAVTLGAVQTAGAFTATSGGDMSFGAATAEGNVSATSHSGSIAFSGAVQGGENVSVQAANGATLAGGVSSMGNVNVTGTQGNVSVNGVSSNGDTTLTAGQTLTLSGTSVVAGGLTLTGGNVTMSGSASATKNLVATAQGTLDASQASLVTSQNLQLTGATVDIGQAIVGGALNAQASSQLNLTGGAVDVVGGATLTSQGGFYNAGSVLAGGDLNVSGQNVINAANASLVSVGTTTVNASNFTNAGLVNGTNTVVNAGGTLNNSGGSLMGLNALTINTGALNNQGGLIFAGNPQTGGTAGVGNLSLTINGGNGSFGNASGSILAQANLGVSAVNMAFDPSQGTISQGGQLSITATSINIGGDWNYSGTGVTLDGINGVVNNGKMSGTAPLTITTNGTFTNNNQVSGNDVTINGTLANAANALVHAGDVLTLNGNVTNRGTIEAGTAIDATGGNYDNAGATTQSQGNITFNLGGTLQNTGGSIFAGNNININAAAVVNDQTAPTGTTSSTTTVVNPSVLWTGSVGTETDSAMVVGSLGDSFNYYTYTINATLGDLLSPTGSQTDINYYPYGGGFTAGTPVAGSGSVTFYESGTNGVGGGIWSLTPDPDSPPVATATIQLPTLYQTTTTQQSGTSGVISAGNSISLQAGSLSNQGGEIAAQGNVTLNIQSLSNGAVAPTVGSQTTIAADPGQYSAFLAQLAALGTIEGPPPAQIPSGENGESDTYVFKINTAAAAPSSTSAVSNSSSTGTILAGNNLTVGGSNLVNAGLMYAGNDVTISSGTLSNQGGNSQNYSSSVGCASGVPNSACGNGGATRGNNPNTTTFSYTQNDASIYAGHDLVIAAGQINNTDGNLLAGHDIVIGGVGTTANSTTPAQSLNNTSGNIVAGNNITLNVSGAITNTLPPPVQVHQNYGTKEEYAGCMTAGGYKESYCEAYVDQQSGSSSVISAGNNLQISAGSLTNIGSLISAGTSATINVAGPVVNEAQTLNAYWHSEWVQETGMFSSDKRHNVWACGSAAECTALYGSAYTSVGGAIDPPTPVGNIAATIQAPNLSISSGGQIQNVGNVLGTSVSLSGQKLINGITTANTYTPTVNAPSQVISLSPKTLPGLNLSTPRSVGAPLPTAVAGTASYVDGVLGSQTSLLGPQQLINALPASLQPSSTLFYYNPQEEDLMLQQAALQQTGQASFVSGLSYDSTNNLSVTEQEKAILYQNALTYAQQNNLQLGTALTQTQINALTQPMLWYVEQTVPDPQCQATGTATCPTITALMPQVYLPENQSALSAGGNIEASKNLTLDFGSAATGGSITNTGSITSGGTLTVSTGTLTNEANQVNVGQIWNSVKGGYTDTTGTEVQPGGFMSAADMSLNVATLNQIGGALQQLNADGTVDQAGTQQLLAQLQQQLGGDFTQQALSDNLHTDFVKQGGGLPTFVVAAIAIAASIITAGAAAAAMGVALADMTLAESIAVGALSGMAGSAASQLASGNGFSFAALFEAGAIGALTAGLTNGITFNSGTGSIGFSGWNQPLNALPTGTSTLGQLAGIANVGNAATGAVPQATATAAALPTEIAALGATATINAGVETAIEGGSFLDNLRNAAVSDGAAVGAYAIGNLAPSLTSQLGDVGGEVAYLAAHAALGCVASAVDGTGCAGGAIGGAASAAFSPDLLKAIDPTGAALDSGQQAALAAFATMTGGSFAALAGQNAMAGATAAQNEALNNDAGSQAHTANAVKNGGVGGAALTVLYSLMPWLPGNPATQVVGQLASSTFQGLVSQIQSNNGRTPPSDPNPLLQANDGNPPNTGASPVTPAMPLCDPPVCTTVPGSPGAAGNTLLSSGGGSGSGSDSSNASSTGPQNLGNNVQLYPDGSLRTPDGKFASVSGSPPPGTTAASEFADFLSSNGVNVVGQEVVVNGPLGPRRYDIVTQDANGNLHGIEVKSGGATPNTYQQFTDQFVNQFGATATGRFAGKSVAGATTVYVP